jgi:hypothetical protein
MKRGVAILAGLLIITIAGGVLTSGLGFEIPIIQQSNDPAASFFEATPNQSLYLLLMIGFILFNVIGAGLTFAFLFWIGNREVKRAKAMPTLAERREQGELSEAS